MELVFGAVDAAALREISTLLEAANLPVDDLKSDEVDLVAATIDGQLVGAIGIETYGPVALLRSLVVCPREQQAGLGRQLVAHLERRARAAGTTDLFLLTETAAGYFRALGYTQITREQAPDAIRATRQFSSLCPDSADLLHKSL